MKTVALLSTLALLWDFAKAGHLSVLGRRQSPDLARRAIEGSAALTNTNDVQYTANITLGGVSFPVLIDTGSADLWVSSSAPIPGAVNTGATSGVQYAVGAVQGPVQLAPLTFAGHTVPRQAFIYVSPDDYNPNGTGLIGLGPSIGSNILSVLRSPDGNTPLDSIFIQNMSTPNYITILLGRANEPGGSFPGDITVGELLPGYEAVTSQPKLDVSVVSLAAYGNQHWQSFLDEDGIIGPDGKAIPIQSVVTPTPNRKRLLAVFDSGFSLPQIPKAAADAIYGSFQYAEYVNLTGVGPIWSLPCTSEVNIAFKLGGITYRVHPIDAVMEPEDIGYRPYRNAAGVSMCYGAFQPISFDSHNLFDMILGMGFMRNTYTYINFGDFIAGSPSDRADPYIQLLSTTNDTTEAHNDFVQARGGSTTPFPNPPPTSDTSNSPSRTQPTNKNVKRLVILIGACALGGLLLMGLALWLCCCRRRDSSRAVRTSTFGPYAPLGAPAPAAATDIHMGQPKHQYNEPWAPRY